MKRNWMILIGISLYWGASPILMADEKTNNENDSSYEEWRLKQREDIKDLEKDLKNEQRKAEILKDQDKLALIKEKFHVLSEKAKCFSKNDDMDVDLCLRVSYKKMAEDGNFVAQNDLGYIYENNYQNKKMAIYWYKKTIDNSKTPNSFKYSILEDIERLEKK